MTRFFKIDCQMTFPDEKRRSLPFPSYLICFIQMYTHRISYIGRRIALTPVQQSFYVLLCAIIPWTKKIFGDTRCCLGETYNLLWGPKQDVVVGKIIKASDL